MTQHLAIRQTARQHGMHGSYIQQSLTRESALTKHILVNLRARGAIRVDAALPGKQPMEQRKLLGYWQGRCDARLQDAVTADDGMFVAIDNGLVVWVGSYAD